MDPNPEISVIIPALNEEKYIDSTLKGLGNQTFKSFETIIVDGGSKDRTKEIVGKRARLITERRKGPAAARNSGAKAAKGSLFVFIDADTIPSRNLLKIYHNKFSDKRLIAATGPILPLEKGNPLINVGYSFVSFVFVRLSVFLRRPCIVGANFAVRSDSFGRVKGFNPKMITYEDWDLSMRLKRYGKVGYVLEAEVETSTRRISEWGIFGFFKYYISNMTRYTLLKKPKEDYQQVR